MSCYRKHGCKQAIFELIDRMILTIYYPLCLYSTDKYNNPLQFSFIS